jgi:hypothetical protein
VNGKICYSPVANDVHSPMDRFMNLLIHNWTGTPPLLKTQFHAHTDRKQFNNDNSHLILRPKSKDHLFHILKIVVKAHSKLMYRRLYFSEPNAFSCHRPKGKYQRKQMYSLLQFPLQDLPLMVDESQSEYEGL